LFQPRTESEQARAAKRLLKRQQARKRKLEEAGIEYDFDAVSYVRNLVIPPVSALTPLIEKARDRKGLILLTLSLHLLYVLACFIYSLRMIKYRTKTPLCRKLSQSRKKLDASFGADNDTNRWST
jgi:hypothetical protein